MKRRLVLAVGVVFLCWGVAWAGSPTDELRAFFVAARHILQDPSLDGQPEERFTAIRALAHQMFDFREAARLALGPDWNERTPAEQDHFVQLFSDLLARSFIAGIAGRIQIATDGVKVRFVGESRDGGAASVRTTMVARDGSDLPFDYRMVQLGGRWVVRDVSIDGVGLTANYRAQFSRILQSASFPDLVRQMQDKASPSVAAMLAAKETPRRVTPASARTRESPPLARAQVAPPARVAESRTSSDDMAPPSARASAPVHAEPDMALPVARVQTRRDSPAATSTPGMAGRREPEAMPAPLRVPAVPVALPAAKDTSQPAAFPGVKETSQPATSGVAKETSQHPAARVVPATPAVKRLPSLGTTYWVQVAAFKNLEAAMRLAAALQERPVVSDRWAVMMDPGGAGEAWARVRVGPFANRTAAAASARDLETRGYRPFIAEERRSSR